MIIPTSCGEDPVEQLDPPAQETPTPEDPEPEPEPVPEPETPDEPTICSDSVMVSLALSSLEWNVSPMSRASNDDLYGLIVFQSRDSICHGKITANASTVTQTALAIYDNPSLITLKLAKNQLYHFSMIYVPNGKNLIESDGKGGWKEPFALGWDEGALPELNKVVYKRAYNTVGFVTSDAYPVGGTRTTLLNTILRYHGICSNFKPDDNNNKAVIKLYRWQYGIRITVTNFNSGKVLFRTGDNTGAKVVIDSNSTGTSILDCNLQFPIFLKDYSLIDYGDAALFADEYKFHDYMEIVYVTSDNEELLLWKSSEFPFKRMKMHTLEFSLDDAITNGGIKPDLVETEDTPMEEVGWNW